jgi:hypothetical protein
MDRDSWVGLVLIIVIISVQEEEEEESLKGDSETCVAGAAVMLNECEPE